MNADQLLPLVQMIVNALDRQTAALERNSDIIGASAMIARDIGYTPAAARDAVNDIRISFIHSTRRPA